MEVKFCGIHFLGFVFSNWSRNNSQINWFLLILGQFWTKTPEKNSQSYLYLYLYLYQVQDAQVAMKLYTLHRKQWERQLHEAKVKPSKKALVNTLVTSSHGR